MKRFTQKVKNFAGISRNKESKEGAGASTTAGARPSSATGSAKESDGMSVCDNSQHLPPAGEGGAGSALMDEVNPELKEPSAMVVETLLPPAPPGAGESSASFRKRVPIVNNPEGRWVELYRQHYHR